MTRVAVIHFDANNSKKPLAMAQAVAKGIEGQGVQVELFDGTVSDGKKLTIYSYLVFVTNSSSPFFAKPYQGISAYLGQAGTIGGKRCSTVVCKKGLSYERTQKRVMSLLEAQGLFIRNMRILANEAEATYFGQKLMLD